MQKLKQNTVVKIYETFETAKYLIIIMEYVSGGDLLSYVKKRNKLNESVAKYIFRQIILSLEFTHQQNIIHRDIKLDNILLDIHGNIKICDFGVSKHIKTKKEIMYDQCGTPAYIAPEILRNDGFQGGAADIWSSGIVLYAMVQGRVPFFSKDIQYFAMNNQFAMLRDISTGTNLFNIEYQPSTKGKIVRSAGSKAKLLRKYDKYGLIVLPSGEKKLFSLSCYATIGIPSNSLYLFKKDYKAGNSR
jgi:serine/threonine protein kinase